MMSRWFARGGCPCVWVLGILLFSLLAFASLPAWALSRAQDVSPTNTWIDLYGLHSTFDGQPLQVGDYVAVFDPDGVQCGEFVVHTDGAYGLVPCYGDDPNTPEDEGAEAGDVLHFAINGFAAQTTALTLNGNAVAADADIVWNQHGDLWQVDLDAVGGDKVAIGDFVWFDSNANSMWDNNENGIDDVLVLLFLDRNGNRVCEPEGADAPAVMSTHTDLGVYRFLGVSPSNANNLASCYCVAVSSASIPYASSSAGGNQSPDAAGDHGQAAGDDGVPAGSYVVTQPFCATLQGSVANDQDDPNGYADSSSYMSVDFGFHNSPNSVAVQAAQAEATRSSAVLRMLFVLIALMGVLLFIFPNLLDADSWMYRWFYYRYFAWSKADMENPPKFSERGVRIFAAIAFVVGVVGTGLWGF